MFEKVLKNVLTLKVENDIGPINVKVQIFIYLYAGPIIVKTFQKFMLRFPPKSYDAKAE